MKTHYLYKTELTRPERAESMPEEDERIIEEHFRYLKDMLDAGELLMAGPCLDFAFGVVVFEASSITTARKIMENDPAVKSGVMKAELHPFKVSLLRK